MVHKSAFPFTCDPELDFIHRRIVQKIHNSTYTFNLPQLNEDEWNTVCSCNSEKERLEFVGDALMSAGVAEELYITYEQMTPRFYTITRSALTANSTFAHLMHRVGYHNLNDPVKRAGDAFEAIIGAYQKGYGHDAFRSWLKHYFSPLIQEAGAAHQAFVEDVTYNRSKKRKQIPVLNYRVRPYHTQRPHRAPTLMRRSNMAPSPSPKYSSRTFTPKRPSTIRKYSSIAGPSSAEHTRPRVASTPIVNTDECEWEDADSNEIKEISAQAFYHSNVPPRTPKAAISRKAYELASSTREILRTIKMGTLQLQPETPTPTTRLQECSRFPLQFDVNELAEQLKRTPLLGTSSNPIVIE